MAFFFNPNKIQTMKPKSSMKPKSTMKPKSSMKPSMKSMKPNLEINFLDEKEMDFLTELISNIIEIDIDENFDTKVDKIFKNLAKDINVIKSTKNKLDTLITKYHMSGLEESLKEILSKPQFNKGIKYIMENKSNSIKNNSNSIKNIMNGGGKAEANRRIVDAILYGVNKSHQVTIIDQVKICQCLLFITLILLLLKLMIHILFNNVQGIDHPSNIYLKRCLVAFMKLWYNIVGRTIVQIDNPVVEIDLPYDSVSEFDYFDHDPNAWMGKYRGTAALAQYVPENAEDEIMQKIDYFKTVQSDRKYKIKYLFNKNNNVIRESIRKLEIELNNLLQPENVLTNVEYVERSAVSKTSIFDNKRFSQAVAINETDTTIDPHRNATAPDEPDQEIDYDIRDPYENASAQYQDDIVIRSDESGLVPMRKETKDILLTFIKSCLEYLYTNNKITDRNNTTRGGTLKTTRNKKIKNRTKKNKR